jgi:hypothetical protein
MRSSWAPEALFCALSSSGSTCDHTHFDQNSFVLNINGEWIFNDPGYRNIKGGWNAPEFSGWRYTVMSYGHNTLLVDGKGQDKRGHGRIVDFFHSPWIDYAAGDATLAYPDGVLKKFVRNILCVHPKFLIIWDEIESPQPARFELLFHPGSHSAVNCDGKTLSLKTIRRNNIKLHSLLPEDSIMTMSSFPGLKKDKASYAELSTKERKLSVDFLSFIKTVCK